MKFGLYILIFLAITMQSCRNNNEELFRIQMEARIDIGSGLNSIETHVFVLKDVVSNMQALMFQKSVTLDQIKSVNPATAIMEGIFNNIDYSIVDEITINIIDSEDPTMKREVFYQEVIQLNHTGPLQLFGSLPDVKDILSKDNYDLEVEMRFRTPTTITMENSLLYTFVAYGE